MAIKFVDLRIINKQSIPQLGDEINYKVSKTNKRGIVLSIESVFYDERYRLNIRYKVKVLDTKKELSLHVVGEEQ